MCRETEASGAAGMITYSEEHDALVCVLPGSLDTAACNQFGPELLERVEKSSLPVVFDMSEVEFVASAFLSICIKAVRAAGEERFRMQHVRPLVRKVLDVTGLSRKFVVE